MSLGRVLAVAAFLVAGAASTVPAKAAWFVSGPRVVVGVGVGPVYRPFYRPYYYGPVYRPYYRPYWVAPPPPPPPVVYYGPRRCHRW